MFLRHRIDLNVRLPKRNRHKAGPGKLRPGAGPYRPGLEYLEQRELLAVTVFQQGVAGYSGTQDTSIFALAPDFVGAFPSVTVSGPTNGALGRVQGLIRFDNIIGTGPIPVGAKINAAALTVNVGTTSPDNIVLNRMLADWNQASSTWNSLVGGVQTNNVEAVATSEGALSPAVGIGLRSFNVTSSVQAWSTNSAANRGWVLNMPTGASFWECDASELGGSTTPVLAVDWTAPTAGTFDFSLPTYSVNEGTASIAITVTRSNGAVGVVAVNYAATSGTATADQDFTAVSGTLTFAANVFSQTFNVPILNDTAVEPNETILLTLSSPTGGSVLGSQATAVLSIVDNDGAGILQFSAANVNVAENVAGGNATITVSRTGGSNGPVTVQYVSARGSATSGQDYTPVSGTLTWANGDAANKTITVALTNDTLPEVDENLKLILSTPTGGAALGSQSTATLTLVDDDSRPTFQQGVAGYTGTQDAQIFRGQPNTPLNEEPGQPTFLRTDGGDGVVGDAGYTSALLRFNDLFGTGANQIPLGSLITSATLTISFDPNDNTGDGIMTFNRMVQDWSPATATDNFFGGNGIQLNNIEALATADARFGPGIIAGTPIQGSSTAYPIGTANVTSGVQAWSNGTPNRGWNIRIDNSTDGLRFFGSRATTAANRPRLAVAFVPPQPGYLSMSEANYTVDEAGSSLTVTVNRQFGSVGAVSVNYATSDGTATADQDYTATSGTLTWAAGDTSSKTFTIPILNNALVQPDHTILVSLSNPTGSASLGDNPDAVVIITDNDGPGTVQFSAPSVSVNENGGTAVLTLRRTGGDEFQGTVAVDYAASSGTAILGQDFTNATGTVTFNPGETSKTITIPIVDNGVAQVNRAFGVTLSNPTAGATLGSQTSATVTILDNERRLVLQQGLNGYTGTDDTEIQADDPGTNLGTATTVTSSLVVTLLQGQSLLRFNNLFGTGPNQIPANATIASATLTVQATNGTVGRISLHRMLANWTEATSTWNNLTNGVQFVTEAFLIPDRPAAAVTGTGARSFDVTSSLQTWLSTANPNTSNLGWLFFNDSADGWSFASSEATAGLTRPRLEVVYSAPAATAPLRVTSLTGTSNGFTVGFNQPFDSSQFNVIGSVTNPLRLPDVVLTGPTGVVPGSLVVNPTNAGVNGPFGGVLTFVSTSPLAPGSYTVTLRSSADGFKNLYGGLLLDGNGDGTAGDNYTNTFTVAAPAATARVVSIPNFVRGPNQAVNVTTGIPIRLSNGQGVTAVSLQIRYDPVLLTVTAATALPAGSAIATFNTDTPGVVQISFTSAAALAAGAVNILRLTATVPTTAPYGAKEVLDLVGITINTGTTTVPAVADSGVHIVGYLGDTNGNGGYDSADAVLVDRYLGDASAGFAAFKMADPILVGDITQDGQIDADDTTAAMQLAAGLAVPNVPARPANPASPIPGGPDPRLYIPTNLVGAVGATVTVPVLLEVTDPAGVSVTGVDVALRYDASRFAVSSVQPGDLLAGFRTTFNTQTPGELRLVASAEWGPELAFGTSGALFLVDFTVLPGAAVGTSAINLVATLGGTTTGLYGNDLLPLTLLPAPTDAANDPGDGIFTVTAAVAASGERREGRTGSLGGSDRDQLANLALLLSTTDQGLLRVVRGNLEGAPSSDPRDAFFRSYGSEADGPAHRVDGPLTFANAAVTKRSGDAKAEGQEGSASPDGFDVDAFFGSLGD